MAVRSGAFRVLLVVPFLLGSLALALGEPSPAAAASVCNTTLTGTVYEAIVVPEGAHCSVGDASIRGGVTVEPGGFFSVADSEVRGSISATNALAFIVFNSTVRGGVTVTGAVEGARPVDAILIGLSEIRGDLVLTAIDNGDEFIKVYSNNVRGSVVLRDNVVDEVPVLELDEILVADNKIRVNLDCSGNLPDVGGGGNSVGGVKTGQCAGL